MKNIFKYINVLIAILLLASCDAYLDVNTDPNNPTSVSPDLVLPVAQKYSAEMIKGGPDAPLRLANHVGNMMMYNWTQTNGFSWYADEFKYLVTSSFYQRMFEQSYYDALKQYQVLINLDPMYDNYKAIAKIMKAYHFQLLVDFYGDIPYSEALLRGENPTPKYDGAQTIYENLMLELTEAIDVINNVPANAVEIGTDDAMFAGNMDEWKKFANTVKLRILTRQMSMSGRSTYIQTEFDVIAAEGSGFITEDIGINPGYVEGEENKQNPLWNMMGSDPGGNETMSNKATCATDYVISYLQGTNDSRIDYLYEKPADGHLGVPQGLLVYPENTTFEYVSNIGPGILKRGDMDAIILTLAECYFNQAEAVENSYISGDPKALYESGIQASFDYLGAGDASSYYGQAIANVSWNASTNKLEAIITQKWIAVNGITAEQSWFDYNRTGYPLGLPVSLQASTPDRPVRLAYPSSEISANGGNVPAQPDVFTTKIFWGN
ncbi:MAG: SusD/RagB family nutrient-binding outer membrane lipoprotein [Bacteroidales bacterium]|nr:SusD/RagB family nutrient-binding outer membrane lipoprotein [Bacteroidales bacterium]